MSSDTHEPLAAILAEMRDGIHTGRADIIDCVNDVLARYADRIEAAEERSKTTEPEKNSGNAAAMRGALETIRDALKDRERDGLTEPRDILERHIVEQALAAPVRNCDRFATAEEAVAAFADHLRAWENAHGINSEYPDHPVQVPAGAFAWFFAQAEEGGGHA